MAQTRARSRSAQPAPSGRKPRSRATARPNSRALPVVFDADVIDLSNDEENQPKRKKARIEGPVVQEVFVVEDDLTRNDGPSGVQREGEVARPQEAAKLGQGLEGHSRLNASNAEDATASSPDAAEVDPVDRYLSLVLEVVPDVDPEHAMSLIRRNLPDQGDGVVQTIIHHLFENPMYPKVDKKGKKRKRDDSPPPTCNYLSVKREFSGGPHYTAIALNQLWTDFPYVPKGYVEEVYNQCNKLYTPTHLLLLEQSRLVTQPFKKKTTATKINNKGKRYDAEFERERQWLQQKLIEGEASGELLRPVGLDGEPEGVGITCGCCFDDCPFDDMVQCPEAHLFCKDCMKSYVSNLLGQHDPKICCMDQSGCKALFPESELCRFLDTKLLSLYYRVKQTKEIEAAGLEGLEECPFCEYKVVIDNPDEKLFRCENDDCGVVSCRACKKAEHLPKSCEEAAADKGLDARHKIEEAMTEALKRDCPNCKKPFIKEAGCNKMTCPHCHTLSCYVCRKPVTGYDHFDQRTPEQRAGGAGSSRNKKCPLWEDLAKRHDTEVEQARNQAMNVVRAENPNVDAKVLEVEVPKTTPAANAAGIPGHPRVLVGDPLDGQHDRLRIALERAQVHVHPRHLEERLANLRQQFQQNIQHRHQIAERDNLPLHVRMQRLDARARVRRVLAEPDLPVRPVARRPLAQPVAPAQPAPAFPHFPAFAVPPNMQPIQMVPPAPPGAIVAYANVGQHHPALHINVNANLLPPNAHYIINHNHIIHQPIPLHAQIHQHPVQPQQHLAAALQAAAVAPPPAVVQPAVAAPAPRRRRRVR